MKAREEYIYAATFALELSTLLAPGYPHAWRVADTEAGRTIARIGEWERWCADNALARAGEAVKLYRYAAKGKR